MTEPAREHAIVGTTISGRYLIERLLGTGGMGAVYLAEHTLMHKRVAVKVLHAEMSRMEEVVTRFEREAMAAAHIEHPNVASATDFGKLDDGSFFLVLELIEGKSLREQITAAKRFSLRRAAHVLRQIASALSRAHGLGIVHRDLKPENVMLVTRDGDADFVKVLDFGIAKVPVGELAPKSTAGDKALTQVGMIYGTPEYMAPEQALGQEVDRRADLYSLGVIAFELLSGARPFEDESKVKLLGMHITAPVPPLPSDAQVPQEFEMLVKKLLAKDAGDRVQDAREVIEALDALNLTGPGSSGLLPASPSAPVIRTDTSGPIAAMPSRPSLSGTSGSHPTVLALEAQAKSLAGDVTRILPPKVLMAVGAVLALVTLTALVLLVAHVGSPSSTVASASASGPAVPEPPAHFDKDLKKAQADLGAANYDAVVAEAHALALEAPGRGEPLRLLFKAHAGKGDTKAALGDAAQWLAVDPAAQGDGQLQEILRSAVASREDEAAAFALLESGRMGSAGADLLYDLAYGGSAGPQAQSHAKRSLAHADVMKYASVELQLAEGLRSAKECEAKKKLLDAVASQGDARSLAVLESLAPTNGCGFLGTRDCWSCMHKDGSLAAATAKLKARIAP